MEQLEGSSTGIIGIDCATQAKRVGLALGFYQGGSVRIVQVLVGSMVGSVVETAADWASLSASTVVALDAPLGWPEGLGRTLNTHEAGMPVAEAANKMFRRGTDRFIKQKIGKQPLDVGADRIARTAHAALEFLQELRQQTGEAIPLAWDPVSSEGTYAIEVYPGATLAAHGANPRGYKSKEERAARRSVLALLEERAALPDDTSLMEDNTDALDAALCVLAATDFLRGEAFKPADRELAKKEGWIWVRMPGS